MNIDQDLHIHTNLSSCAARESTLESYLPGFRKNGLSVCGITNHLWDAAVPGAHRWYVPQNFEHISEIREEIRNCSGKDEFRFLVGAEVEYCYPEHRPAISEENAEKLDFLIVPNSHTHIVMPKDFYEDHRKHAEFMYNAFLNTVESPVADKVTAIAHPFWAVCCPYGAEGLPDLISDKEYTSLFDKTAKKGIALEFNTSCFGKYDEEKLAKSSFLRVFKLAKQCGCKFTFGSDAHAVLHFDLWPCVRHFINLLDLTEDDIRQL